MNTAELYALTQWVEQEFSAKNILKLYAALQRALEHNTQENVQKQPFEEQKNSLLTALRTVDLSRLTVQQVAFLERLKIAQHMNEKGAAEIEDIFFRNSLDINTAARRVKEINQEAVTGYERAKRIRESLDGFVDAAPPNVEEALLRITFSKDAAISDVSTLKKWAADWHDIGRGIAMVHGLTPQDVRIVGATSGSIILEIAVIYGLARTVASILLKACDVAQRYLNLRKTAEEVRSLKLSNDKAALEIEKDAEAEKAKAIEEISAKVLSELNKAGKAHGEEAKVLDKAVHKLVLFVQQGGEVDCVVPAPPAETPETTEAQRIRAEEIRQLQTAFQTIRVIESKVRVLGVTYKDGEEKPEATK